MSRFDAFHSSFIAAWRLAATLLVLLGCVPDGVATPRTIAYQGFLSTPSGAPLNTDVALTFRIYRDATGSERLWTERHPVVPVRAGLFLVALGSIEPLDNAPALFEVAESLYLSVEVEEDGEMMPRLPLASAPYSLAASATRSAATTVDCTAGETIADALARAPAGGEYTLELIGTCAGNVIIRRNNVVLRGNGTAKILGVTPNPHPANAVVYIDGGRSVVLRDVIVEGAAGDTTGMHGVVVDNGASGGLFDDAVVHKTDGVGVFVLDNSSWDIRGQVRDTGSHGVRVEGNSHVDLQDAVIERPGPGSIGFYLRIHSSGTVLRSTVRSVDYAALVVDGASTLVVNDDTLIESAVAPAVWATMAVYRGSAARVAGSNLTIRNTNPATYTERGAYDPAGAAGGIALDVEHKSMFINFGSLLTIEGWVVSANLSSVDLRYATINGHIQPAGARANIRLRDQSGIPGRVTLNGNILLNGPLSIRTGADAALINGNVDCRGSQGVSGSIQFLDPEDGYINCAQFASDLSVTLSDSPDPVGVGQTVTYTAEIVNQTLSPAVEAVNANASFSLSGAAATILDATGPNGTCTFDAFSADCFLGRVRTGAPATVTLSVRRDAPGTISNFAEVTAWNSDPDFGDNTVEETNESP